MKTQEIREMSVADLRDRIDAEKQNLNRMKMNHVISPLEDTSKIKKAKKVKVHVPMDGYDFVINYDINK